jgi:hypothetical protein
MCSEPALTGYQYNVACQCSPNVRRRTHDFGYPTYTGTYRRIDQKPFLFKDLWFVLSLASHE